MCAAAVEPLLVVVSQASLEKFACEGVRFALERAPDQIAFLDAMLPFVAKQAPPTRKKVGDYFEAAHARAFPPSAAAALEPGVRTAGSAVEVS